MPDIPKFGYPRRIDIVDAVNELGGAVEAVRTRYPSQATRR